METKNYLRIMRKIIHDNATKNEARLNPKYFTRTRKLPFSDVLCVLLDMQKTALQARLNHFFETTGQEITMTEQALSKVRRQFNHTPFEKILRATVAEEYSKNNETPKWNGYHLFAVDGSVAQLPDTAELRESFGVLGRGEGHACAGMSVLFDVENGWVINPIFTTAAMNERNELLKHIAFLKENMPWVAQSSLFILDRGYPSAAVFEELEKAGIKFLCRCSKKYLSCVNAAPSGDSIVKLESGMKLRVYKFPLKTGEEETLVTNLFDEDCALFSDLYAKRWEIETAYGVLKNKLCVESFSGRTVNTVLQDLWVSMVLMNVVAVLRDEADEQVRQKRVGKANKYTYATNTGELIVALRDAFIFTCLRDNKYLVSLRLSRLVAKIAKAVLPIRPHRNSPRKPHSPEKLRFPVNLKSHL